MRHIKEAHRINAVPGDRVRTDPATDAWMQGERYGYVKHVGQRLVMVTLDSGRVKAFRPGDLLHLNGTGVV